MRVRSREFEREKTHEAGNDESTSNSACTYPSKKDLPGTDTHARENPCRHSEARYPGETSRARYTVVQIKEKWKYKIPKIK